MGQLLFKKVFWDAIRAGSKRTTVRRWNRPRVRAGARAFAPGLGWLAVESVDEIVDLAQLSEADALADGFESVGSMVQTLLSLYSSHETDGKRWFRVSFRAEESVTTENTESTEKTEKKRVVEREPELLAPASKHQTPERRRRRS